MDAEKKLALMQNTYAASVAETVNTYSRMNVLDRIVEQKAERQAQSAGPMMAMLGICGPEEVFLTLSGVFGCANWQVEKTESGFTATATACKLCALSKKMGGANPCRGWCLDPMAAMVSKLTTGSADFHVKSTLMEGEQCQVEVSLSKQAAATA